MHRARGVLLWSVLAMVSGACDEESVASSPAPDAGADAAAHDAAVAGPEGGADLVALDAGAAPRVVGTLTLPGMAAGKRYGVRLLTMPGRTAVAETSGLTTGAATVDWTLADAPPGTYFLLGFVDVDGSGGDSSSPGDFAGWYGHGGDGNPPAAPNATVPASGTVRFDFALVLR